MTQVGRELKSPFLPACLPFPFDLPRPLADPVGILGVNEDGDLVWIFGRGYNNEAMSDRKGVTS